VTLRFCFAFYVFWNYAAARSFPAEPVRQLMRWLGRHDRSGRHGNEGRGHGDEGRTNSTEESSSSEKEEGSSPVRPRHRHRHGRRRRRSADNYNASAISDTSRTQTTTTPSTYTSREGAARDVYTAIEDYAQSVLLSHGRGQFLRLRGQYLSDDRIIFRCSRCRFPIFDAINLTKFDVGEVRDVGVALHSGENAGPGRRTFPILR